VGGSWNFVEREQDMDGGGALMAPVAAVMERKMLLGIEARAQALVADPDGASDVRQSCRHGRGAVTHPSPS
jgi:hypothetical protein